MSVDWNRFPLYAGKSVVRNNLLYLGRKEINKLFIELDEWEMSIITNNRSQFKITNITIMVLETRLLR